MGKIQFHRPVKKTAVAVRRPQGKEGCKETKRYTAASPVSPSNPPGDGQTASAMPVPIVDLNDQRFRADDYGYIAELSAQAPYARTPDGAVVFFDQADVMEVLRCVDFRFAFNWIDATRSP